MTKVNIFRESIKRIFDEINLGFEDYVIETYKDIVLEELEENREDYEKFGGWNGRVQCFHNAVKPYINKDPILKYGDYMDLNYEFIIDKIFGG